MSTSGVRTLIKGLSFDDKIYVKLNSGDILALPYDYTKRLSRATVKQLSNYRLIGGGRGIHFPEIDEDISLEGIIHYKMTHDLMAS